MSHTNDFEANTKDRFNNSLLSIVFDRTGLRSQIFTSHCLPSMALTIFQTQIHQQMKTTMPTVRY